MRKNTKGFTLIELLVVVLIIGILAAVAVPQYNKAVMKSRLTEVQTFLNAAEKAVNMYVLKNGFPTTNNSVTFADLDIDLVPGWEASGGTSSYWNPRHEWTVSINNNSNGLYTYIAGQKGVFAGVQIWSYYGTNSWSVSHQCDIGQGFDEAGIPICNTLAGNDPRWTINLPS